MGALVAVEVVDSILSRSTRAAYCVTDDDAAAIFEALVAGLCLVRQVHLQTAPSLLTANACCFPLTPSVGTVCRCLCAPALLGLGRVWRVACRTLAWSGNGRAR
jgi:hypothetical protein